MNAVRWLILPATLLAAACSSAPVRFHTLVPPAPAEAAAAHTRYSYALMPVTVPAQVDTQQLVVRQGQSELAVLDGEHWIAPLESEIRSALSAEIGARTGAPDISRLRAGEGQRAYRVRVDIRRFESLQGQSAGIEAGWSILAPGAKSATLVCESNVKVTVGSGLPALVLGHQQALSQIGQQIAKAIIGAEQSPPGSCPKQ